MTTDLRNVRLLLIGAIPRLLGAVAIITVLWALFFLATSSPGAL